MGRKGNISQATRIALKEKYGDKCWICGAEGAEYHHLVPLSWGGTNDLRNFIPLCYEHHMIMHGVRGQGRLPKTVSRHGRNRKIPENYKDILGMFVHCEIGNAECKDLLGVSQATHLTDRVWFHEYMDEMGIDEVRNVVDVAKSNGCLYPGRECGYIKYKGSKKREPQFYHPQTVNIFLS